MVWVEGELPDGKAFTLPGAWWRRCGRLTCRREWKSWSRLG
jgi:hypothetical protein